MECLICKEVIVSRRGNIGVNVISNHLRTYHNYSAEEYTVKYLLNNLRPKCPICGKNSKFRGFATGFARTCGNQSCTDKIVYLSTFAGMPAEKLKQIASKGYKAASYNIPLAVQGRKALTDKLLSDEDYRKSYSQNMANSCKEAWDNTPLKRQKERIAASNTISWYKDLFFDNYGNSASILYQGYEDLAINFLLVDEGLHIEDIQVHTDTFYYTKEGRKHIYYPDLFLPKSNTFVEVKSDYTVKLDKNLELKQTSVLEKGYNYRLLVFSSTELLEDIKVCHSGDVL